MTDGELRGRGTILYPLVYAATLTLVAVSSFALATLGHDHVIDTGIQVSMRDDQAVVRGFVESNLTAADVQGGIATPDRRIALEASLADLVRRHGYVGVGFRRRCAHPRADDPRDLRRSSERVDRERRGFGDVYVDRGDPRPPGR